MKKLSRIVSIAIIAVMLCGIFNFAVSAANPIVIDFSKYDSVLDILASDTGGQGEFDIINDGEKRVLFAECVDGYDPADDPDGKGLKGDLYTGIVDFADLGVDADTYQWIRLGIKNASAAPGFEVHFSSPTKGYNVETSITFDIDPNSDYKSYIYNVTEACKKYYPKRAADVGDPDVYPDHWHGLIDQLRLDFMYYEESGGHARTGDKIYIEYIAFFDSEQAAKDFVFTPARTPASIAEAKAAAEAAKTPETEAPAPAAAPAEDVTAAPADAVNDETAAPADSSEGSGSEGVSGAMIAIIAAAAVIVIVVIVVIVVKPGKKK